jgi:hypothetical protein
MSFSSPFASAALKEKNRKTGRLLAFVILGLVLLSIATVLIAN